MFIIHNPAIFSIQNTKPDSIKPQSKIAKQRVDQRKR